jgi:5-methyltetrahydrofolate--homocysteine methyltransferase
VLTSLGVSNVSFGITPAARGVLNSVFLYHAVAAGLDMAIVNPAHITPISRFRDQVSSPNALIFNEHPNVLAGTSVFREHTVAVGGDEQVDPPRAWIAKRRCTGRLSTARKTVWRADRQLPDPPDAVQCVE